MTSYVLGGAINYGLLLSFTFCVDLSLYQTDFVTGAPLARPDDRIAAGNFLFGGVRRLRSLFALFVRPRPA